MSSSKRVLVTGHRGYIGPHLVELLKERGDAVTGVDLGLFDGCEWYAPVRPDVELAMDVRDLSVADLEGHDCVIHLAAISNDPMGDFVPELTRSVNLDGSVRLARLAKQAGVPRFLFSSSCSVYGQGADAALDEDSRLCPLSVYAESKILTEQALADLADATFCPAYLRNSTAFGHSPMFRVDLVVNNLLACAWTKGAILIKSDGTPWRPLIHCRDIARAFVAFLDAPAAQIHNRALNIGADAANYRVRQIADLIQAELPHARIEYTGEAGNDPRNYRVDFGRFAAAFPDFRLEYDLRAGIRRMMELMREKAFSLQDFEGDRFTRLKWLRHSVHKVQGRP